MTNRRPGAAALLLLLLAAPASAREEPARGAVGPAEPRPHRFWDRTNVALFAGVAGSRALDYDSTRNFRSRGVSEALLTNSIVDNKPLFIAIEAGGTALSIAASAWLHGHGHHTLERWVSIVHIGVTTFGAARNYTLGR